MAYVRVATYSVRPGTSEEVTRRVNETLVPLYREQPGFESLSVVDAGDYVISISRWDCDQRAREGAEMAIAWVKQQSDLLTGPPLTSHFGTEIVAFRAASP
jgi:heme-degrading monooxygenase HmoA